jgi:cytochrome b561
MIRALHWITAFLVIPVIVFIEYHIGTWAPIEEVHKFRCNWFDSLSYF